MTNVHSIDNRRSISDQLAAETVDTPKTQAELDAAQAGIDERMARATGDFTEKERRALINSNPETIAKATRTTEELDKEWYQKIDAEVRQAEALARVRLDAEQNAALATSLAPAMNDIAHRELSEDAMHLMVSLAQLMERNDLRFHARRLLETLCWKFNDFDERIEKNQDDQDLKIAACFNNGSEIQESRVIKLLDWKDQLTHQQFIVNDLKDAAERAFFELTGESYMPATKKDRMYISAELVRGRAIAQRVMAAKAADDAKKAEQAAK